MKEAKPQTQSGHWADLQRRLLSSVLMAVIGGGAIVFGGAPFAVLVIVLIGGMFWEFARLFRAIIQKEQAATHPPITLWQTGSWSWAVAGFAIICLMGAKFGPVFMAAFSELAPLLLVLPAMPFIVCGGVAGRNAALYALCLMLAGKGLLDMRHESVVPIVWIVALVVASDVGGYFAGKALGGAKFWPKYSPKKTWSGTVAGWVAALGVSGVFVALGLIGPWALVLAPLMAFAGQMGDIWESAFKRHAGVKDSSALIPGHGGLLDRFDALVLVVVMVELIEKTTPFFLGGRGFLWE